MKMIDRYKLIVLTSLLIMFGFGILIGLNIAPIDYKYICPEIDDVCQKDFNQMCELMIPELININQYCDAIFEARCEDVNCYCD